MNHAKLLERLEKEPTALGKTIISMEEMSDSLKARAELLGRHLLNADHESMHKIVQQMRSDAGMLYEMAKSMAVAPSAPGNESEADAEDEKLEDTARPKRKK